MSLVKSADGRDIDIGVTPDEKLSELATLLVECRDALPAISIVAAALFHVKLDLADRIDAALEPWRVEDEMGDQ